MVKIYNTYKLNNFKMRHPKNYWKNEKNILEESKKYKSRTEFKKKSNRAYDAARKLNLLDKMEWLSNNKKHPKGYWKIKENVINESKKYASKDEFQKGNLSAFLAAHRYGYIDEMTWLVKQKQHKKGYWTYENIEKEAVKYETKTDFQKNCNVAYRKALQLKIIDDFFTNDYIQY